ncbi:hypothetical protein C5167_007306 [Papaver somniferum]|nr:hypothetical protein C5167_007306 [Papaver somniferum]
MEEEMVKNKKLPRKSVRWLQRGKSYMGMKRLRVQGVLGLSFDFLMTRATTSTSPTNTLFAQIITAIITGDLIMWVLQLELLFSLIRLDEAAKGPVCPVNGKRIQGVPLPRPLELKPQLSKARLWMQLKLPKTSSFCFIQTATKLDSHSGKKECGLQC